MRNFKIVFQFEFLQQIKKRAVLIPTILLAIVTFIGVAVPAIINQMDHDDDFVATEGTPYLDESIPGGYFVGDEELVDALHLDPSKLYKTEDALKSAVKDGDQTVGYAIYDLQHFKTYYHDKSLTGSFDSPLTEVLKDIVVAKNFEEKGISYSEYQAIRDISINAEEEILGKDTTTQYALAFAYIIILYMVILLYGSTVATAVAREKDSRTMELLITTADPKDLIMGKVMAVTAASVLQMSFIICSGLLSFLIFKGMYPKMILMALKAMLDFSMIGVYIFYFILGLLLYMFIFAALGSVVSRMEDVNSAISPVMFLFIFSYMIAIGALQSGDTLLVKVASWIPFFSVMVMPIRYAMTSLAFYEIIGSTVLTIIFIYLFAGISIRIYRWGTLNYGNKPNFFKVCKEVLFTKQ